jgi:2-polyprenyl-3-methyl-5-hydroxy-6-metoxy-1,4-benzoquinol methylase
MILDSKISSPISDNILEIMRRRGVRVGASEFQNAVNITFHEFESEVYDQEHSDMWNSLPQQFGLLVGDCLRQIRISSGLRLLDVGCGTGLAFECLLHTAIGEHIKSIDLIDTSPAMLKRATDRARKTGLPVAAYEGLLDVLPPENKYDVIVTCSVLHHVPDVQQFLLQVRRHQADDGIFLHLQDPNGDFLTDIQLNSRIEQAARRPLPNFAYRLKPARVIGRLRRIITARKPEDYISKTNSALLQSGIVATPLTVAELFSITDIHVHDDLGISFSRMKSWLPDYRCIAKRTYGFYGRLWSTLPASLQKEEEHLIQCGAENGFHIGAAWRLCREL